MTETAVVKYDITDAAVAEMKALYMGLIISDLEDTEQFDAVRGARMVVKNHRVAVEKRRKELKADALAWGRKVDSEAKRIFGLLAPIETHLMNEEKKVTNEQKRIKKEQDRIEREKIQGRVNSLQMYGAVLPFQQVAVMTDEEFETTLAGSKEAYEAEQKRLADEEAARKAEEERLEKKRLELEKKERLNKMFEEQKVKDQEEAQRKIDAENKKIADEKAALEAARTKIFQNRQEKLKKYDVAMTLDEISKLSDNECDGLIARSRLAYQKEQDRLADEVAEQAKKDAQAEIEREEKERLAKEAADKAEAERQEELKPDKEKMLALADQIEAFGDSHAPDIKDHALKILLGQTLSSLGDISRMIRKTIKNI